VLYPSVEQKRLVSAWVSDSSVDDKQIGTFKFTKDFHNQDGNSQDGNSQDGNSQDGNSQDGNSQDDNEQGPSKRAKLDQFDDASYVTAIRSCCRVLKF
jgi:hypothetical protein